MVPPFLSSQIDTFALRFFHGIEPPRLPLRISRGKFEAFPPFSQSPLSPFFPPVDFFSCAWRVRCPTPEYLSRNSLSFPFFQWLQSLSFFFLFCVYIWVTRKGKPPLFDSVSRETGPPAVEGANSTSPLLLVIFLSFLFTRLDAFFYPWLFDASFSPPFFREVSRWRRFFPPLDERLELAIPFSAPPFSFSLDTPFFVLQGYFPFEGRADVFKVKQAPSPLHSRRAPLLAPLHPSRVEDFPLSLLTK